MVNKIWNKQDKCRVWLMEMPDAEKPKRTKGFGDIDKMTVSLLRDKGIRITKSSSITPKGIFKVKNGEGVAGKLDSFKRKIAESYCSKTLSSAVAVCSSFSYLPS